MKTPFMPGLELSRRFYREAVRPILDAEFPGLVHSAARIGGGSEVLALDTRRSADHEWGPRLGTVDQHVDNTGMFTSSARSRAVCSALFPQL